MFISWLLSIIYRKCSWPCRFKANSMFFSIFCWRCEDRIVNITLGAIGNDYEWQVTKMKVRTSASINIFTKKEYSSKIYSWGEAKRQFLVDFSKHSLRNYFLRSVVSESTRTQSSCYTVNLKRRFYDGRSVQSWATMQATSVQSNTVIPSDIVFFRMLLIKSLLHDRRFISPIYWALARNNINVRLRY